MSYNDILHEIVTIKPLISGLSLRTLASRIYEYGDTLDGRDLNQLNRYVRHLLEIGEINREDVTRIQSVVEMVEDAHVIPQF